MIILDSISKSLEIKLSSTVSSSELQFTTSYVDITATTFVPIEFDGLTNGTSAVTIVSSPVASTQRQWKFLSVYNSDTQPASVILQLNDNGSIRIVGKFLVNSGGSLIYNTDSGFTVLDSNGLVQTVGLSGYSGVSGFSGSIGNSGFSGFSGVSGYSGLGLSGTSGFSGLGLSGTSGTSGFSGYSGVSGYSGYSGVSGFSGSGISGYSGVSGTSGASGFSGASGYSGFSGDPSKGLITFGGGRNNAITTDQYLRNWDGSPMNQMPFVIPVDATLIGIGASFNSASTGTFEVRSSGTMIASLTLTGVTSGFNNSYSVDVAAGDQLEIYINGTATDRPSAYVILKRR